MMRSKEQMDKLNAFINSIDDHNAPPAPITYRVWNCPKCKLLFSTIKYGWSSRWRTIERSDGKLESTNERVPTWIKCPHCKSAIDFDKFSSSEDHKEQFFKGNQVLDRAPLYLLLDPSDFMTLGQTLRTTESSEHNFYLQAWHRFNDLRENETRWNLTSQDIEFLDLILSNLSDGGRQQALYKAEILRELGRFEDARTTLDRDFYEETYESQAEQIMRAIERSDMQPFTFQSKERDGNYEFKMAWRTRRYVSEVPEDTDVILDPPIFKIKNRDWWIKVLGMLSHNWALIEENSDKTATVFFFQDTPEPLRPAVIDSFNFENIEEAQIGLRRNQFSPLKNTPGPWLSDVPKGHFFDNRSSGNLIYSKLGYWED